MFKYVKYATQNSCSFVDCDKPAVNVLFQGVAAEYHL